MNAERHPDSPPKIVVVGSINLDLVFTCQHLPSPGQTITASGFHQEFGGKGANQAVAAARAGGRVQLIGRLGDDPYGKRLAENLRVEGVNIDQVPLTRGTPSGLAMVTVEESGENSIVVVPGANANLSPADIRHCRQSIADADCMLVQMELPLAGVVEAVTTANEVGTPIILDPAPAPLEFPGELWNVDLLTPNETEAMKLLGSKQTLGDPRDAAAALQARGPKAVCLTLGANGTMVCDSKGVRHFPAFTVRALDTTAAGDTFAGALAVAWCASRDLDQAVRFANIAGALATQGLGAQSAMPRREEIEAILVTGGRSDVET